MSVDEPTAEPTWTIGRLLNWTADFLKEKGADSPRLDAEILLAHARGCQRIELYTAFEEEAPEQLRETFRGLIRRRSEGTPVAYLVGYREFFSLNFDVTSDVLIPRPETEMMVLRTLDLAKEMRAGNELKIADVGTGSGILAICCAKHLPTCSVTAIDISASALAVAKRNAAKHEVDGQIEFVESDLFAERTASVEFDLILSNPPYVTSEEMASLAADVREYEPHLALDGGVQGTEIIERLIPQAVERLRPDGWLLMEVGPGNAERVGQLVDGATGITRQETIADLAGLPRVVQGQRDS